MTCLLLMSPTPMVLILPEIKIDGSSTTDQTPMEITDKVKERFWSKVNKTEGCWEWVGSYSNIGYGHFKYNYKVYKAHRFSFILHYNRDITHKMCILHSCDNRKCVNPDHLREGTQLDNMRDMVERNRCNALKGNNHAQAKLTDKQVINIRELYAAGGITQQQLANQYTVSRVYISDLIHKKTWKHI